MNPEHSSRCWKYWVWRLVIFYLMGLATCVVAFPIVIYIVIPFTVWLTADIPYALPTGDYLMKWVRYGLFCIFWIGTIFWLSEFIPWLIRAIRSRDDNGPL